MPLFHDHLAIGMQLPIQSQSTIYAQPWEADATPDDLGRIARACDVAGFGYVAVCDHVAIPDEKVEAMSAVWYDTVATLAWLAAMTERVHLLSHVYVASYRHPLQVAKSWSTLDALSGGRAILGVGAGHVEGEFDELGVPFAERGRRTDDCLQTVSACFADGGVPGFSVAPPPARPGGPPIWIGGSSPAALRRTARFGSGWLPQSGPDQLPSAVARIRELQFEYHGEERPIDVGALIGTLYVGEPDFETPPHTFSGPPERLAAGLARLAEMGANQVQVRFASRSVDEQIDQIERFGTDVLPLVVEATS